MAAKQVVHYAVFHNIGGTTDIVVYYDDLGEDTISDLSLEEASFLIDLLRTEDPIAYDADTRRLSTPSAEEVGESE